MHDNKHEVQVRISNYGIAETIRNVFTVLRNKVEFPGARLIRYPVIVRGKKYIDFGKKLTIGYNCRIEVNGKHNNKVLSFGENVNIGDNVNIRCANGISIGNNVLIGSRVLIIDNSHGKYSGDNQDSPEIPPNQRKLYTAPIVIEDNVWIGEGTVIQAGVKISTGSIVAANSVVTKDVKAGEIVGGLPAKVIKRWNQEKQVWL
nr:DapH/DapD/GlmU-related protein [uncultured Butyrivibrio sp.]